MSTLLIQHATIVTMNDSREVIEDGAILIESQPRRGRAGAHTR